MIKTSDWFNVVVKGTIVPFEKCECKLCKESFEGHPMDPTIKLTKELHVLRHQLIGEYVEG